MRLGQKDAVERPTDEHRNLPALATQRGASLLDVLDQRIESAPTDELPALIRARGELVAQEEARLDGAQNRWGRKGIFIAKVTFSAAAVVGGAVLIGTGFGLPGFFLLGGGVAVYVPDYAKNVFPKLGAGGHSEG